MALTFLARITRQLNLCTCSEHKVLLSSIQNQHKLSVGKHSAHTCNIAFQPETFSGLSRNARQKRFGYASKMLTFLEL